MHDRYLNRVLILLLIVISLIYVFTNYYTWLTPSCIAPVGADIKFHQTTVHLFLEQLDQYGFVYPMNLAEDIAGFSWYVRAPVPIIVPAIFNLFLSFNAAFYLVYMLAYILLILAFYSFTKELTNNYTAFLMSIFFLFSAASNMIFSVGGNYQFLIGLIFFFFSCKYFLLYTKNPTKKNLVLWILSAALMGLTYTFSLVFFTSFILLYMLVQRDFKKIQFILIPPLLIGFFLLPVYVTSSYMDVESSSDLMSPMATLKTYILPTTWYNWIYLENTNYQGQLDFNHGPHIYIIGLVFLVLLFRKEKTPQYTFIKVYLVSMLIWLSLGYLSNIVYLGPISRLLRSGIGSERVMFHTYLAFLFVAVYGINRFKIVHWKSLIITTAVGMIALGTLFFKSKFFFALVPFYAVAIAKAFFEKEKSKEIIISSLIVYLLLFPLTGKVETTNLQPRPSAINVDGIQEFIKPGEVFYFLGGWSLEQTILSCARARSVIQIDRDSPISGLSPDFIDLLKTDIATKQKLETRGVQKIVIALDMIVEDGKVVPEKVNHLVSWYGQPEIFQTKDYYPFLVFKTNVKDNPEMKIENPVHIIFSNQNKSENFLTGIEYHPWWRAFNDGSELETKNKDGFVEVHGTGAVDKITLNFSLKYFYLGAFLSLIGVALLVVILRKRK